MVNYRRPRVPGATYFFTVALPSSTITLRNRGSDQLTPGPPIAKLYCGPCAANAVRA
jgi:hypothetical protein